MVTKEQLDEYTKAYMEGHSLISDEEYDALVEEYVNLHGEESRPFTRAKQSDAINDIVGTLPKCYNVMVPMRQGQPTYFDWVNKKKIPHDAKVIVQPKLDGGSVAVDLNTWQFATRGDYDNGESEDVTDLFIRNKSYISKLISDYPFASSMKFESIMPVGVFNALYKDDYKRPRDAMSGLIHSRNKEAVEAGITLMPLRIMHNGKMKVFMGILQEYRCMETTAGDFNGIEQFITNLLNNGAAVDIALGRFECDGVVVSVVDDNGYILDEVAIKILNMVEETKLIDIKYQIGKTGRITPVAILEPVNFGKVTVDHATLSNLYRVNEMKLKYNDTVRIMYNIVPYFLDSKHDGDMLIPMMDKCPSCGTPFNMKMLRIVECTNPNCDARKNGNLIRYCNNMKMMGVGDSIISDLWEAGLVREIPDLYKLTSESIQTMKGYREKSADNILRAIHKSSNGVPLERWLGSLPITGISTKTWKTVIGCSYGTNAAATFIERLKECDDPESIIVELRIPSGCGILTLNKIAEGLRLNWDTIKEIIKNEYVTFSESKIKKSNGIKVAMSGTRDATLTKYLEDKGYEVCDYNNSCSFLVIPSKDFTSSKVEKALAHNKTVITVEEAYNL